MILYKSTVKEFRDTVDNNRIVEVIEKQFKDKMGRVAPEGEKRAWNNSMRFMETIVRKSQVADDCGILIEYNIPSTSKRIDFVIAGRDDSNNENFVIVELKQWSQAEATSKEDVVRAYVGQRNREVAHPSYQAYSYKKYLSDMNEAVYTEHITPVSCAYLHNYNKQNPEPLLQPQYQEVVKDTPMFFSEDAEKLERFLKRYVGKGKGMDVLYKIENGKIAPSKKFVEYVSNIFDGNEVYTLLDEQKVAYSNIIDIALNANDKTTIIVNGGPGTGKSVVAVNALVCLLKKSLNLKFVAPNASFRSCTVETLTKNKKYSKGRINALFSGSGSFVNAIPNEFDVLICDEAHRLKKQGAYMYKGVSQVEDIIKASKVNVFFVDNNQCIRPDDEGTVERIIEAANRCNSKVKQVQLKAQFRCSGAEGFLNWIDNTLQIQETANFDGWDSKSFDFNIFDDPNKLYSKINEKVQQGKQARMLAGFAWTWTSEKEGNTDAQALDVNIPEHDFKMPWNSKTNQYTWATDDSKRDQIGCVHTSQGLEFDYVGVIIGNDLKFNPNTMEIYADYNEYFDSSGKKGLKENPQELTRLVKNVYKVLLSRGMKGCFVYCRDKNLQEYLKSRLINMK